ncbi:hypothetical protein GCM10010211_84280 [Streptomyces albospinus]|uniref:MFS transporter n=1 Tax=Streptomyces albospinus TaxID=285515 RepID=A0ABQ2VPC9_9ACTN|nr:hypothetical protein [Streptomyces albospinus]GGV04200.1 hypothetical protein GCM10010211_84280 [Streptomyces albospinus]
MALQEGRGWSVLGAGAAFLAPAAALAAGGPLAGRLRPGAAVPVMALCLAVSGGALWAVGSVTGTPALLAASTGAAAALGVAGALALTGTQAVVRRERAGEASGVTKAVMTVTAGLGLSLTGTAGVAETAVGAGTAGGWALPSAALPSAALASPTLPSTALPSTVLPAAVCVAGAIAVALAGRTKR